MRLSIFQSLPFILFNTFARYFTPFLLVGCPADNFTKQAPITSSNLSGFNNPRSVADKEAVATPTFSVAPGAYGPAQLVSLSTTTTGATIFYTTDGTRPTKSSLVYSTPINVSSSMTLKAFASKSGFTDSARALASYTINGAAATPTFSVAPGAYGPAQLVSLSTTTTGATIFYTTDGTRPTKSSLVYSTPINVSSSMTLKAFASKSGFTDSSLASVTYPPPKTLIWFVPNQMAGSPWNMKNGHLEESFGDFSRWPGLRANLLAKGGGLGTYAAEIGHMSSALLNRFRAAGIPLSVEMPASYQCYSGGQIAKLEFDGTRPDPNINIFEESMLITAPFNRPNPDGLGWFVSADGVPYRPESITLDERYPQTNVYLKFSGGGNIPISVERSVKSNCSFFQELSGEALTQRLVDDYVAYAEAIKVKWPTNTPRFSFHWNVNTYTEAHDKNCVTIDNKDVPDNEIIEFFIGNSDNKYRPCKRSNSDLQRIVDALCKGPGCPDAVYMDVDWLANNKYSRELLENNKKTLNAFGVSMGINLANQAPKNWILKVSEPRRLGMAMVEAPNDWTINRAAHESQKNLANYIVSSWLYDRNGQALRIQSWGDTPIETGDQVSERVPYSFAHTANEIFKIISNVENVTLFSVNNVYYRLYGSTYCAYQNSQTMLATNNRTSVEGIPNYLTVPKLKQYVGLCN